MREEHRQYRRHLISCELRGKALTPMEDAGEPSLAGRSSLRGMVTDIGAGGLGLLSDDAIDISDPFVCEVIPPDMAVGIPTLVQVRWVIRDGQKHRYRLGLQFLV
jgi:hypothetical protein